MKSKTVEAIKSTVKNAIVAKFTAALDAVDNSGSHIYGVFESAQENYSGKPMPKEHIDSVALAVSSARGWKSVTAEVRMSEIRSLLRAYVELPKVIKAFKEKNTTCSWHQVIALARAVNSPKIGAAKAAAFVRKGGQGGSGKGSPANPKGKTAGALKFWYSKANKDQKAVIAKAVALLKTIGLKAEWC